MENLSFLARNGGDGAIPQAIPVSLASGGRMNAPRQDPLLPLHAADITNQFFLDDTSRRLGRMVDLSAAWFFFVLLLCVRFLTPRSWTWVHWDFFWVLIFSPLFVLDFQNFKHTRYLKANRDRLPRNDYARYRLVNSMEFFFKAFLCLYLSIPMLRVEFYLDAVVILYCLAYVANFLFLNCGEDELRAESCNAVHHIMSSVARFFTFVFVISVTLKVESANGGREYDWQTAMWPAWGMEGMIVLLLLMLVPITICSVATDHPRVVMLIWLSLSVSSFGVCIYLSAHNIARFLDDSVCAPCEGGSAPQDLCQECQQHLYWATVPFLIYLSLFGSITHCLKARLAVILHETWYQPLEPAAALRDGQHEIRNILLPPPVVMFKVSATYYKRECDLRALDLEDASSLQSARSTRDSSFQSARRAWSGFITSWHLDGSITRPSNSITSARGCTRPREDPYSSFLSAQGSSFTEIVSASDTCGICMDYPPEAVLLECGHAGICMDCAKQIQASSNRCHICRDPIPNIVWLRPDIPVPKEFFAISSSLPQDPAVTLQRTMVPGGSVTSASHEQQRPPSSSAYLSWGSNAFDTVTEDQTLQSGSPSFQRAVNRSRAKQSIATQAAVDAVAEAKVAAETIRQPLASPPWNPIARPYAVMVEAVNRAPSTSARPWWMLIFRRARFY